MRVYVKLFGRLSRIAGWFRREVEVPSGSTVAELLELLASSSRGLYEEIYSSSGGLAVMVLVNGRSIEFLEGLSTRLREGDSVALVPPAGGG